MVDSKSAICLRRDEHNCRDRFTKPGDVREDTEIFSPIVSQRDNNSNTIDWLDQYTNAHRIGDTVLELMRVWLLKIPFHEILNELKMNYVGKTLIFHSEHDRTRIQHFIDLAIDNNDAKYLLQAYTANTPFFGLLNKDLAKRGSTFKFEGEVFDRSRDDQVPFNVGQYLYAACLIHHPSVDIYYHPCSRTYRGMNLHQSDLNKYVPGARILTRSFLSTSVYTDVAGLFLDFGNQPLSHPVLCIYHISQGRSALKVSDASDFPEEQEILIRPFVAFRVENVEVASFEYEGRGRATQIFLKELPSTTERWELSSAQTNEHDFSDLYDDQGRLVGVRQSFWRSSKHNAYYSVPLGQDEKERIAESMPIPQMIQTIAGYLDDIICILSRHQDEFLNQSMTVKFMKELLDKYCLYECGTWVHIFLKQLHQTVVTIKQLLEKIEIGQSNDTSYLTILFERIVRLANNLDTGVLYMNQRPSLIRDLKYENILDERRMRSHIPELFMTLNERFAVQCSSYIQKCIDLHSHIRIMGIGRDTVEDLIIRLGLTTLTSLDKERLCQSCDSLVIPLQNFISCTKVHSHSSYDQNHWAHVENQRISLVDNTKQPMLINDSRDLYRLVAETPFLPQSEVKSQSIFPNSSKPIEDILQLVSEHRWMVILGDPGSAKTTLARWLTLFCAKAFTGSTTDESLPARLPVLARIGEIANALDRDPTLSLLNCLCQPTWFGTSLLPTNDDGKFIREYIQQGHALIILDGLDEVPNFRQRQHIVRLIEQFLSEWTKCPMTFIEPFDVASQTVSKPSSRIFRGNQMIITSRIVGYYMYPITSLNIAHYTLDPLSTTVIVSFIDHWFLSIYSTLDIPSSESTTALNSIRTLSDNLKSLVANDPEFQRSISNPMMLSVLCTLSLLQRNENILQLPKQRICLLDTTSKFLLKSWLQSSNQENIYVRLLISIAVYLHQQAPSGLIEELDMRNILRRYVDDEVIIDEFMRLVASETGPFVPRGLCIYGFLHLTFQEYFVSLSILRHEDHSTEQCTWEYVADQFHRHLLYGSRFREPLILALSYISWHWTKTEYESFCNHLVTGRDTKYHHMPLGAICILASIPELVRLPSAGILQTVLNQCMEASVMADWLQTFPMFKEMFKTALDVLSIVFIHEWLMGANNSTIEAISQFVVQMDSIPTWMDQSISHFIYNQLIMSNSRFNVCLFGFISSLDKMLLPNNDLRQYMMMNQVQIEDIHPLILSVIIALCGGLYCSTTDDNIVQFSPEYMHRNTCMSPILIKFLFSDPQTLLEYCRRELSSDPLSSPVDLRIVCCCLDDCYDELLTLPLIEQLQHLVVLIHTLYLKYDTSFEVHDPDPEKLLELAVPFITTTQHVTAPYSSATIIIIGLSRLLPTSTEYIRKIILPDLLSDPDEEQLNSEIFILSGLSNPGLIPAACRRLLSCKDQSILFNTFLSTIFLTELSIDAYERLSTKTSSSFTVKSIQATLTVEVARWISAQIQIVDLVECRSLSNALFKCETFTGIDTADHLVQWLSLINNFYYREFAYHAAFLLFNINSSAIIICIQLLESEMDDFRRRAEKLLCNNAISCWRFGQEGLTILIQISQNYIRSESPHLIDILENIRLRIDHINHLDFLFSTLGVTSLSPSFSFIFDVSIQSNFVTKLEQCADASECYIATVLLIFSRTKGKWNKLEVNRGISAVVRLLRKYSYSVDICNAALAVFIRWNSKNYIKHIMIQTYYPESTRIRAIRCFYRNDQNMNRECFLNRLSIESSDLIINTAWEGLVWLKCTAASYDSPTLNDLKEYLTGDCMKLNRALIALCADNNDLNRFLRHDVPFDILKELYADRTFEEVDSTFVDTICNGMMKAKNDPFLTLADTHLTLAVNFSQKQETEFFRAIQNSVLGEQGFRKALYIISKKSNICRRLAALRLLVHYGELTIEIADIFLDITLEKPCQQKQACELIWRLRHASNREVIDYLLLKLKHGSLQRRYMAASLLVQLANNNQVSTNTVCKHITDVINDPTSAYDIYLTTLFNRVTFDQTETCPKGHLDQALASILMQLSFIAGTHSTNRIETYSSNFDLFVNCDNFFEQIRQAPRFITCHQSPLSKTTPINYQTDESDFDDEIMEIPIHINSIEYSDELLSLDD